MKSLKKQLLFIHAGGLGDIILLSPVLKILHQELGLTHNINLLTEKRAFAGSQELFEKADYVQEVKYFDFKNKFAIFQIFNLLKIIKNHDIVISSGSSPLISILLFLSGVKRRIGFKSKTSFLLTESIKLNKNQFTTCMLADLIKPLINKNLSSIDLKPKFTELLNKEFEALDSTISLDRKYFLIHPGVSALSLQKNIFKSPEPDFWTDFIFEFSQIPALQKYKLVFIGGSDDQKALDEIWANLKTKPENLINLSHQKTDLKQLAHLIKNSEVFICADSAPMHLSLSINANTLALFGPTDSAKLISEEQVKYKIIKVDNLLCQPCLWDKRSQSCALPLCIKLLSPKPIIQILQNYDQTGNLH